MHSDEAHHGEAALPPYDRNAGRRVDGTWRFQDQKVWRHVWILEPFARPRHLGKEWALEIAPKVGVQVVNNRAKAALHEDRAPRATPSPISRRTDS